MRKEKERNEIGGGIEMGERVMKRIEKIVKDILRGRKIGIKNEKIDNVGKRR